MQSHEKGDDAMQTLGNKESASEMVSEEFIQTSWTFWYYIIVFSKKKIPDKQLRAKKALQKWNLPSMCFETGNTYFVIYREFF